MTEQLNKLQRTTETNVSSADREIANLQVQFDLVYRNVANLQISVMDQPSELSTIVSLSHQLIK